MRSGAKATGAMALVTSGFAAAFALAACCAIPIFLASVGTGANWLIPIVSASQPHADILTAFSIVALVGSASIAVQAPRRCAAHSLCARPAYRWTNIAAAALGGVLLILSKIYA
jgi:mercuric ion transport protein